MHQLLSPWVFLFEYIKTGYFIIDTILLTFLVSYAGDFIDNIRYNVSIEKVQKIFKSYFKHTYSIEYEGKRNVVFNRWDRDANISCSFSITLKALIYYIQHNCNNIKSLKEIVLKLDNTDAYDTYITTQTSGFIIDKEMEIYVTCAYDENKDDIIKNNNKEDSKNYEIITLTLYSYISNISTIKSFTDNVKKQYLQIIRSERENTLYVYNNIKNNGETRFELWKEIPFISTRTFDNMFFEDKENVINKIDFFLKNKEWYKKYGVPHTLGIGLYGNPGTGKTSFIKAMANYTKRHIITISLKLLKTREQLENVFYETQYNELNNSDSIQFKNKIIVFEDIDCNSDIVLSRKEKNNDEKIKKETVIDYSKSNGDERKIKVIEPEEKITLDDLLNIFDGICESYGRIIIITSNHYNKLDPALKRPGRIDITMEMKKTSRNIINKMYYSYFTEYINENVLQNIPEYKYSPAEITNIYYNCNNNSDEFINKLLN